MHIRMFSGPAPDIPTTIHELLPLGSLGGYPRLLLIALKNSHEHPGLVN
jgi:hypothetical protein